MFVEPTAVIALNNRVKVCDLEIEHEIRRMERTLQTFLDFARPPQPDRRWLNLEEVVDRVLAVVKGRAKKQQVKLKRLANGKLVNEKADNSGQQVKELELKVLQQVSVKELKQQKKKLLIKLTTTPTKAIIH